MTSPQRIIDNLSGIFHWFRRSLPVFLVKIFTRFKPFGCPTNHEKICRLFFEGCTSMQSVRIPSSVTSIGGWAFQDWSSTRVGPETFMFFDASIPLKERCFCDDVSFVPFSKGVESFERWNLKVQKWYVCIYDIWVYILYIFLNQFSTLFFGVIWKGENSLQTVLGPCFLGLSATPCLSMTCTFFN